MDHAGTAHAHSVDVEAALDFVNTLEYEDGRPVDHLADPSTALDWLADRAGLHRASAGPASEDRLERVRGVRAAMREVVDGVVADRPVADAALRAVNRVLRERDAIELRPAPDGARVGHRHVADPLDGALARLVEALVEVIARGEVDRLRICANDGCRWAFYDTSRTGRRRWCDMASCGNRAKAARHRARVRAGEAPGTPGAGRAAGRGAG